MGLHADDWFHAQPRSLGEVLSTFTGDWNRGESGIGGFYRPLVRLSFALDRSLFGLSAAGYHLTNGVLFVASCLMVALIASIFAGPRAFIVAGLAMALHPSKNEALYWVSGRTDLLALLMASCALYCWLRWLNDSGGWRWILAAMIAMVAALATKETTAPLVLMLPVTALMLAPGRVWPAASPLVVGCLFLGYRSVVLGGLGGYTAPEPRTMGSLLKGILQSLGAILVPWQNHSGRLAFSTLLGVLGIGVIGVTLLLGGFRRINTLLVGGMVLFSLPLAFAAPSPVDGTRLLAIPLGFLCVLVGLWAATRLRVASLILVAVSLLPLNISAVAEFLGAARPARKVVSETLSAIDSLPPDVPLVFPEPHRTQPRRILDPGDSMDQAVAAHLMVKSGSRKIVALSHTDPEKLAIAVGSDSQPRIIAQSLQPWMSRAAIVEISGAAIELHELERIGFLHEGSPTTDTLSLGQLEVGQWIAAQLTDAPRSDFHFLLVVDERPVSSVLVKTAEAAIGVAQHRGPGAAELRITGPSLRLPTGSVALFAPSRARDSEP
jgi:hypothetical protein